ncbi:MAG: hypothetical protein UX80_C0009G0030 [Candidatus Amesbacteria bacterium GW2011_GWA2_47_11b]|uniref:Uncharacterized protein n=3 Tax=Candidatus Amesiibacteriota TaxID=1752730 RepID=A0A0G1SIY2_9BACT|nr:MAG: hypothetical protein UX00_C0011G0034 [Microgenomates group bacterium GW2011_GWB1_45_17]KKU28878.1 MAG: hypothetical protein UX42_C0006G0030 [Microgenomates group bacterium GW2011_GWC1_46_20]KKU57815.1 MAG: hypothetical protein UX80_C0009G0030 [Candidatus Amesbacteria bacterium GW2011_GWA2_47_11b]KKU69409.1 MAG: hypothetical protein UX92_C0013G0014 [Candidatus Amesbacteria bacterium GW2011_GWA1_47_20]KKU82459.1 MAG: hypothetical protein UY11_C0047G0007 [Candidatus Amesbacteria bacterium 
MKILIPVIAFAILLIFFVTRLPRPRSAAVTVTPSPTSSLQPPTSTSAVPTELQQVINDIRAFRLDDPQLVAPAFSHSLDIPEE